MMRLTVKAPAKLNLFLGVTPNIVGGKHLLTSVFSAITLMDTLIFTYDDTQARRISLEVVSAPDIKPLNLAMEQNIVHKAVLKMEECCGRKLQGHLHIVIDKKIPPEAGLAGGSSDAAATLKFLANLWIINPLSEPVLEAARSLGSDVAFFLYGGCALMGGSGDRFIRQLPQPKLNLVLAKPEGGVSTREAYEVFDADPQEMPSADRLLYLLENPMLPLLALARSFDNNLYPAARALMPELESLVSEMNSLPGIDGALLTGSGSTVFGVCESSLAATQVSKFLGGKGYWTKPCKTMLRAAN